MSIAIATSDAIATDLEVKRKPKIVFSPINRLKSMGVAKEGDILFPSPKGHKINPGG